MGSYFRKALHNKINVVERMLEGDNILGAIQKLEQDIKDKLEKWLVDDYQKENPLQLSKEEAVKLIRGVISRLITISSN